MGVSRWRDSVELSSDSESVFSSVSSSELEPDSEATVLRSASALLPSDKISFHLLLKGG